MNKNEFVDAIINELNASTEVLEVVKAIDLLVVTRKAALLEAYFSHNTSRMSDTLLVAISLRGER